MKHLKIECSWDKRISEELVDSVIMKYADLGNGENYRIGVLHYDVDIDLPQECIEELRNKKKHWAVTYE